MPTTLLTCRRVAVVEGGGEGEGGEEAAPDAAGGAGPERGCLKSDFVHRLRENVS